VDPQGGREWEQWGKNYTTYLVCNRKKKRGRSQQKWGEIGIKGYKT